MPFWFLNDNLDADEMRRQIRVLHENGIGGLVLHPRVGLPRELGWMSDALLGFMRVAIEEASRLGLSIILYDEGMYPSGSSCGQVVASDPSFACRGVDHVLLEPDESFTLPPDANLVGQVKTAQGRTLIAFDRKLDTHIRGLHFKDHDQPRRPAEPGKAYVDPPEDEPPAADLLNPAAMRKFIELVYDRYYQAFGEHFGKTIIAIFTDEPSLMGRSREKRPIRPGTKDILSHVNRILGYDFTPHLPALWYDNEPDAQIHRKAWQAAVSRRLEETYYQPLHDWCEKHGVALTGHPSASDDIGLERHFHIPGQDLVWRYVTPGNDSALVGAASTMAKCASSAMVHLGRQRNLNEIYGAYGHELTFDEVHWLANWTLIRGQNMLIPHAVYYSTRGPRIDERPPDVGMHSPWWQHFKPWAEHVTRLSMLNTLGKQQCDVAVLTETTWLPDKLVRPLYENQIDFNYLTDEDLIERATVNSDGSISIASMRYQALLMDDTIKPRSSAQQKLDQIRQHGRLIRWNPHESVQTLLTLLSPWVTRVLTLSQPQPDVRFRHVIWNQNHWLLLYNEGSRTLTLEGQVNLNIDKVNVVDIYNMAMEPQDAAKLKLTLEPGQIKAVVCSIAQ